MKSEPPDNFQEDRKQKYVDRTSSTNIGLSLLAVITGIDLEFITFKNKHRCLNMLAKVDQNYLFLTV